MDLLNIEKLDLQHSFSGVDKIFMKRGNNKRRSKYFNVAGLPPATIDVQNPQVARDPNSYATPIVSPTANAEQLVNSGSGSGSGSRTDGTTGTDNNNNNPILTNNPLFGLGGYGYPYGGYGYGYGYPVPYYPATQPIIIKEQTTTANTTNTTDNKVPNNGLTNSIKQEINKGVEAYKTNSNVKVAVIGGAVLFGLLMIFK